MGTPLMIHIKARSSPYPGSQVKRFPVPDNYVSWSIPWPEYEPVDYTADIIRAGPEWADPDFRKEGQSENGTQFNALDGGIDRRSILGCYELDEDKLPRNPMGRTGIKSRGLLGKWGPNHAADPIVTRWKREADQKVIHKQSGKPILQFVAIKRKDCGEWAIPGYPGHDVGHHLHFASREELDHFRGHLRVNYFAMGQVSHVDPDQGMVDNGELVSATLKREFGEEALNSLTASKSEKDRLRRLFQSIFSKEKAKEVYAGYVDDPRNTDNAWMESVATNFHDDTGNSVGQLDLQSGDDARRVQWFDIDQKLQLYATHSHFLKRVTELWDAHW